ncbi:hypothetical protein [Candidatus Poriferisodalis sp.]|uniref:hypothetical protein n=1 Tax=Candidatus Poriferisodalis sp. TaxID=3101277 RepID=UPI003B01807B
MSTATLTTDSPSTACSSASATTTMRPMHVLRKRIVAGLLAATLVFAVVACSSDDPNPGEPGTPQVGS